MSVAVGPFGEEAGHKHEKRHMEQVDDVEGGAEHGIRVVHGVRHVAEYDQDDEDALYVVEQRDPLTAAFLHASPPLLHMEHQS